MEVECVGDAVKRAEGDAIEIDAVREITAVRVCGDEDAEPDGWMLKVGGSDGNGERVERRLAVGDLETAPLRETDVVEVVVMEGRGDRDVENVLVNVALNEADVEAKADVEKLVFDVKLANDETVEVGLILSSPEPEAVRDGEE